MLRQSTWRTPEYQHLFEKIKWKKLHTLRTGEPQTDSTPPLKMCQVDLKTVDETKRVLHIEGKRPTMKSEMQQSISCILSKTKTDKTSFKNIS